MKRNKEKPRKSATMTKDKKPREFTEKEKQILREAMSYCLRHFPMLWTTGGIKEESTDNGLARWIISVFLRYPTGHEGYLGDLLYDGTQFIELTDRTLMRERAKQVAADPERLRKWNGYRASVLPTAEG
jgi:hypothetical protein